VSCHTFLVWDIHVILSNLELSMPHLWPTISKSHLCHHASTSLNLVMARLGINQNLGKNKKIKVKKRNSWMSWSTFFYTRTFTKRPRVTCILHEQSASVAVRWSGRRWAIKMSVRVGQSRSMWELQQQQHLVWLGRRHRPPAPMCQIIGLRMEALDNSKPNRLERRGA
jgi:hypothetical protein